MRDGGGVDVVVDVLVVSAVSIVVGVVDVVMPTVVDEPLSSKNLLGLILPTGMPMIGERFAVVVRGVELPEIVGDCGVGRVTVGEAGVMIVVGT